MIYKPTAIIKCIIHSYTKDIRDTLMTTLRHTIEHSVSDIQIFFTSSDIYWKYPECQEVFFQIKSKDNVAIKDLITLFKLSWHYTKSRMKHTTPHLIVPYESAIWNNHINPNECFLIENISWVHIYTGV